MTNQVGPGLAEPVYGSELRARDRNEVRVSGFHRGPQQNYRLQQGRIESRSPSCQSDHAKAVAKRDAFIERRMPERRISSSATLISSVSDTTIRPRDMIWPASTGQDPRRSPSRRQRDRGPSPARRARPHHRDIRLPRCRLSVRGASVRPTPARCHQVSTGWVLILPMCMIDLLFHGRERCAALTHLRRMRLGLADSPGLMQVNRSAARCYGIRRVRADRAPLRFAASASRRCSPNLECQTCAN